MIRDQRGLSNLVIDTRAEIKPGDVSRVNWRLLGEDLKPVSKKDSAADKSNAAKARVECAHNSHSYKKDNTAPRRFVAIQIFPGAKISSKARPSPRTGTASL
jgi:hypothetical protein